MSHFGYWVKVNIFNYFVVVEGGGIVKNIPTIK